MARASRRNRFDDRLRIDGARRVETLNCEEVDCVPNEPKKKKRDDYLEVVLKP